MSHGEKARRNPKMGIQTHLSLIPSRRTKVTASDLYFENFPSMDHHMMLNPPYQYPLIPISSSSSLPRHSSFPYPLDQFQQPPLLPRPMPSSNGTGKKLYNKDQKNTKQAPIIRPQKHSTHKTKKNPDKKPGLGGVGTTKRWGADPESEPHKNVAKEMNFYESLIFAMSPPPSSLPMPKFSILKPKLSKVVR